MSQVQFFPVLIKTVGSLPPHRNQFNMMTPPTYLPNHLPQVLLQFENSGAGAALSCCKAPTTRVELHLLFWSPTLLLPILTFAQPYYCPSLLIVVPRPTPCNVMVLHLLCATPILFIIHFTENTVVWMKRPLHPADTVSTMKS